MYLTIFIEKVVFIVEVLGFLFFNDGSERLEDKKF